MRYDNTHRNAFLLDTFGRYCETYMIGNDPADVSCFKHLDYYYDKRLGVVDLESNYAAR